MIQEKATKKEKQIKKKENEKFKEQTMQCTYRRKSIAGVWNEHASFSYSTISNRNAFDKPWCTHVKKTFSN